MREVGHGQQGSAATAAVLCRCLYEDASMHATCQCKYWRGVWGTSWLLAGCLSS
jgi:hypothetical protein